MNLYHVTAPEDMYLSEDALLAEARAAGYAGASPMIAMLRLAEAGVFEFEGVVVRRAFHLSDNPVLRSMARRCWPKEQHDTIGAAEAQLRSITKRGLEKNIERIHTYLCPHCRKYHVGHRG